MGNRNTERKKRQRRNRRGRLAKIGKGPARVPPAVNNRAKGSRGPRRPRIQQANNGATTIVHYEELWKAGLSKGVTNCVFNPGLSGLTKLDQFASNWDEYWLESACVRYATSSGTVTSGHLYMGIDYSAKDLAQVTADVTSLDPRCDGPVWENQELLVDPKLAMKKPKMSTESSDPDNTAFACSIANEVDNAGVVWCCYRVHFASPKRDESANADILAEAQVNVIVNTNSITALGVPENQIERPDDVTKVDTTTGTTDKLVQTTFTVDEQQSPGSQLVITSPMTEKSAIKLRGVNGASQLSVAFFDAATGRPLPDTVVKQVSGPGNGAILASVWEFVKPWVKTFAIKVIETFLGVGANDGNAVASVRHVLSHRNIGSVPIEDFKGDDVGKLCVYEAVRQNQANTWSSTVDLDTPGGPKGYTSGLNESLYLYRFQGSKTLAAQVWHVLGQYYTTASDHPIEQVSATGINGCGWVPDNSYGPAGLVFAGWLYVPIGTDSSANLFEVVPTVDDSHVVNAGDRFRVSATVQGLSSQSESVPFNV